MAEEDSTVGRLLKEAGVWTLELEMSLLLHFSEHEDESLAALREEIGKDVAEYMKHHLPCPVHPKNYNKFVAEEGRKPTCACGLYEMRRKWNFWPTPKDKR